MTAWPGIDAGLGTSLQTAIERRELELVYQPKIALATGRLAGVEALSRWTSAEHGPIEPSRFIPLAERMGSIDELTNWGLGEALAQWRQWREQGFEIGIAFNISPIISSGSAISPVSRRSR
jgi:EAL domain-containing protein (putative c-di-GMP-specific phosphodiesterase class I)